MFGGWDGTERVRRQCCMWGLFMRSYHNWTVLASLLCSIWGSLCARDLLGPSGKRWKRFHWLDHRQGRWVIWEFADQLNDYLCHPVFFSSAQKCPGCLTSLFQSINESQVKPIKPLHKMQLPYLSSCLHNVCPIFLSVIKEEKMVDGYHPEDSYVHNSEFLSRCHSHEEKGQRPILLWYF